MVEKTEKARVSIYLDSKQVKTLIKALSLAQIETLEELWKYDTKESFKPLLREDMADYNKTLKDILAQLI